jgi:hypothetical protein
MAERDWTPRFIGLCLSWRIIIFIFIVTTS